MKYFLALIVTIVASLALTPFVIKLAHRIGAIDVPKDDRRVHKSPVPRLGGLAIYVSFLIGMLLFADMESRKMFGFILGSAIIVGTGIIDDMKPLSAKVKLLLQILAASIIYFFGFRILFFTNIFHPDQMVALRFLAYPITIFWIVGVTNTINLIDGLDGLAAGVSAIIAITLAYLTLTFNRLDIFLISILLIGSLLGFIPYNFNPAKIFMGDTGSLFLGFTLAAISVDGVLKTVSAIAIFLPLLVLGLPLFDTSFAMLRRLLEGRPIMSPDKGHLHHRLLELGMKQKKAVLVLYSATSMLGLSAVMVINRKYLYSMITFTIAAVLIALPIIITERNKSKDKSKKEKSDNE